MSDKFEPIIVGFLCNWCSYRAADLAGTSRLHYSPNMRPIRVMCSGRVDPQFVLKAFQNGADGVMIAGCAPEECEHHGNYKTRRRMALLKNVLQQFNIDPERLSAQWFSIGDSAKVKKAADEFVEKITEMGPIAVSQPVG